ncbi:MAG: hypothetical protein HW388_60 [Dehalococcoidia bacterium]|nr:hypothetical protein [Dehalococcoidia bacterium]
MAFDASFYREVLPDRVTKECHGQPDAVPVVNLHLATGRTLDLCHAVHLADTWFAVQHFRDAKTCADMDVAFLPYELVSMVTVSLHHPTSRRMGFSVGERPGSPEGG